MPFSLIPAEGKIIIAAIADAVIAVKVNMPDDLLLFLHNCNPITYSEAIKIVGYYV
ncbi:MAG TPA: hypothetical protein VFY41_06990 [Nitrososphaeraceae archaeon]|nr:hypothetical protein [Nitrososphaeraceae archaeon]